MKEYSGDAGDVGDGAGGAPVVVIAAAVVVVVVVVLLVVLVDDDSSDEDDYDDHDGGDDEMEIHVGRGMKGTMTGRVRDELLAYDGNNDSSGDGDDHVAFLWKRRAKKTTHQEGDDSTHTWYTYQSTFVDP